MFFDFNTFTRMFFYLFVCYQYSNFHYPEKTQEIAFFVCYKSVYLYSKLQILFCQNCKLLHNFLVQYEKYQKILLFLEKLQEDLTAKTITSRLVSSHKITMDFILNNEIDFSFEKDEFINDYLNDFFPDEHHENDSIIEEELHDDEEPQESLMSITKKALDKVLLTYDSDNEDENEKQNENEKENKLIDHDKKHAKSDTIIDYDFIIINGEDNLKKIIKHVDLIKNDIVLAESTLFKIQPLSYKPLLCEFLNGDGSIIKIDFCDNNKSYNFLAVDNCFDKTFLIYFMKKYYEVDVKENYILKVLDDDINTFLFDSSDILNLDEKSICKLNK